MNDIQKTILDIFKVVADLFDKYDITYYAIGGTCIGAVRHQGFIPWDDDLDIAVPIEQYDMMLSMLKRKLPDRFSLKTYKTPGHYGNLFAKVIDENTAFIEKTEYAFKDSYKGVFIDIMPLSGLPSDKKKQKKFITKIRMYRILNDIRRYPRWYQDFRWKQFLWLFVRPFDAFIPENYFSRKWMKLLRTQPVRESEYVGYVWWRDIKDLVFRQEAFADTDDLAFEDTIMKCPVLWDEYLSCQFGDYMKLPSQDDISAALHIGTVDLNHSYRDYVSGRLQLT